MDANHPTRDTLVERKVEEVSVLASRLKQATDTTNDALAVLRGEINEAHRAVTRLQEDIRTKERSIAQLQAGLAEQRKAYNEQAVLLADTILGCAQR